MRRVGGLVALLVLCAVFGWAPAHGEPTAWSYADLDYVLERYVGDDGRVDYAGLIGDRARLDRYVASLAAVSPDSHPQRFSGDAERLAYWINAYNALMLARVVQAWPIRSVKEIRLAFGVFWLERHELGGTSWSLRGLENKIIRGRFDEPRIHFAINCASAGCPALPRRAFRAETLEADLDHAARRFIGDPRHVRIDRDRGAIHLSRIFKWFEDDFTGWLERRQSERAHGLLDYIKLYLPEEHTRTWDPKHLKIEFLEYDWAINSR